MCDRRSIGGGALRDQMPPEVATTGHVHTGPKPWLYSRTHLHKQTHQISIPITQRGKLKSVILIHKSPRRSVDLGGLRVSWVGILNHVVVEVEIEVGVGLRLGLEVSEDEEAGQSGGEEYQDQPQRTHFETKRQRNVNKLEMRVRYRIVLRGLSFGFFWNERNEEREKVRREGGCSWSLVKFGCSSIHFVYSCATHTTSLSISMSAIYSFFSFVLLHVFFLKIEFQASLLLIVLYH